MNRPALVAILAIILVACESAAPLAPAARDNRAALFSATGAEGVCNAVFAQLEHRGTVEEHVLAAAARQNAELIQVLQAERNELALQLENNVQRVAALNAQLANLQAHSAAAHAAIAQLQALLIDETDPDRRAELEATIQSLHDELANIEAQTVQITAELQAVLSQIPAIEGRIAEIDAQLARGGC